MKALILLLLTSLFLVGCPEEAPAGLEPNWIVACTVGNEMVSEMKFFQQADNFYLDHDQVHRFTLMDGRRVIITPTCIIFEDDLSEETQLTP